jgi:hypothetical protein
MNIEHRMHSESLGDARAEAGPINSFTEDTNN